MMRVAAAAFGAGGGCLYLGVTAEISKPSCRTQRTHRNCQSVSTFSISMDAPKTTPAVRLDRVGGHMTELLELHSPQPSLQIVFIPGNPGIVAFYQDYVEALFRFFDGRASITAVSHIAHTAKDWENGKQYSLEQQTDHKAEFLKELLRNSNLPLVLVGHSIGAYMILELLKKFPEKIQYVVGLYPFLKTNSESLKQMVLKTTAGNSVMRAILSSFAGLLGQSPGWLSRNLMKAVYGRAWGPSAVDVACNYLLQSSMVGNFAYMGMTEFQKLQHEPDWQFLKEYRMKVCLLFGRDDHWGPLSLLEQVHKEAPGLDTTIQAEDISHDFCCTRFGSDWVARYTADAVGKACPAFKSDLNVAN